MGEKDRRVNATFEKGSISVVDGNTSITVDERYIPSYYGDCRIY
jgi:hypothetical protein